MCGRNASGFGQLRSLLELVDGHAETPLRKDADGARLAFPGNSDVRAPQVDAMTLSKSIQGFSLPFIILLEDWTISSWNRGAERVYGHSPEEMIGRCYLELVPESLREEEAAFLTRLRVEESTGAMTTKRVKRDGSVFHVHHEVHCTRHDDRAFLTISDLDITARVRAERRRELLVRELDHRVKNTLALVQALLEQTRQDSNHSIDSFTRTFRERLTSLAVAHRALAASDWEGAMLHELVKLTVQPLGCRDRISIDGDEVTLPNFAVLPLAMALHELGTNAVRHGSLSDPGGTVSIRWRSGRRNEVSLIWTESGGTRVRPPSHSGFGTKLIEQGIPYEMGGTSELEFRPEGVRCKMRIPLKLQGG